VQPHVTFTDPQDARDLLEGRLSRLRVARIRLAHEAYNYTHALLSPQSLTHANIDQAHTALLTCQSRVIKARDALGQIEILNEQIRRDELALAALEPAALDSADASAG